MAIVSAARASAAPCPAPLYLESSNGKYYVAVFSAPVAERSSIDVTMYSKTNAYSASLSSVSIEKPWKRGTLADGFRSFVALLANPGNDPLLGATVRPYGLADGTICPPEEWIVPSIEAVSAKSADAEETALKTEIAGEAGDGSNAFTLTPVPAPPTLGCAVPFADAKVRSLVIPEYTKPAGASATTAYVRVDIAANGTVTRAAMFKASGDPAYDAAALTAARKSTYTPRVFACVSAASSYVLASKLK